MAQEELKAAVAAFMKRAYGRGLTTATGGNVSARDGSVMLITPSGKDKASLSADDIASVDILTGTSLSPGMKLSIETEMHRLVYAARPDIKAIVHAHPVFASLFSASEDKIDTAIIAESWYLLGDVRKVPYHLMGTRELAEAVAACSADGNALLLENHGAIAFGRTLLEAFDRLECLEQSAKLTYISRTVGITALDEGRKAAIAAMR